LLALGAAAAILLTTASVAEAAPRSGLDVPEGVTAAFAVFDRTTGETPIAFDEHKQFRSASVVKLLIALDYLESHGPGYQIPAEDLALLQPMLRASNDDAASELWVRDGWEQIVQRMIATIGLTDSAPPANRGMWGYTAISAADVVKIYRYILDQADPSYRDFIMGNLRLSKKCADDGFDQSFGIPSAIPRPWAVKQGWSKFGAAPAPGEECVPDGSSAKSPSVKKLPGSTEDGIDGGPAFGPADAPDIDLTHPAMHTTGTVGPHDEKIVVVLTLEPDGTSWRDSATRITALTRAVYLASEAVTR
jgi:hypothetical protein